MKKFLRIRNVVIGLILLLVVVYIAIIISRNPNHSKTSKLYDKWINQDVITMKLEFKHGTQKGTRTYSTDQKNNKTVIIVDTYDDKEESKKLNTTHIKSLTIMENGKTHVYQLNYDLKTYKDFGETESTQEITSWMEMPKQIISDSKYFTKKSFTINGKKVDTEIFDKNQAYFGYENGELVIIQTVDNGYAYDVSFEEKFIEESLYEIPEGFTLKKVSEDE